MYGVLENIKVVMEVRMACRPVLHAVLFQLGRSVLLRVPHIAVFLLPSTVQTCLNLNRTPRTCPLRSYRELAEVGIFEPEFIVKLDRGTTKAVYHVNGSFLGNSRNSPGSF